MRQEAWRAYLEMALGVTEASGKKALKTAKKLVGKGGMSAEQLQGLADELVRASAANREAITNLVRVELERALSAVGLAKADEVQTLTARVRELEAQLQAVKAPVAADSAVPTSLTSPPATAAVAKTVAKKTVAKKATATAPPATKAPATKAPAKKVAKKATPAVGEPLTAPAPGPAGPEPAGGAAAPAKKAARKTTKRTPGSGEPVP